MITNVSITSVAMPMMPGYYQITVKAVVQKPFGNAILKSGYPKASLAGGTVMLPIRNP